MHYSFDLCRAESWNNKELLLELFFLTLPLYTGPTKVSSLAMLLGTFWRWLYWLV